MSRFDLTGKVAWVIGGAGLLGSAVSRDLAEHGATIIISDLREEPAAALSRSFREDRLDAHATALDIGMRVQ